MVLTRAQAKKHSQKPLSVLEATRRECDALGLKCNWVEEEGLTRLVCADNLSEAEIHYRQQQRQERLKETFLTEFLNIRRHHELDLLWEEQAMFGQLDNLTREEEVAIIQAAPVFRSFSGPVEPATTTPNQVQIQPMPAGLALSALRGQKTEIWS